MDLLERLWIVVKRRWPVLFGCIAVAAMAAALYNTTIDRTYTASTELFLRAPDNKTSASAYQGDLFSRQRAQSYSNMLSSDELAQMVIDKLGLQTTPQELASHVKASTITNTVIMTVSATDSNPQRAANIANAYGSVFAEYVARVENVEFDPNVPPLVRVITTASADDAERSGLAPMLILAAAIAGGVVVGVVLIWLLERYDTTVRSRRQIADLSGYDVIGRIPSVRGLSADTTGAQLTDSDALTEDVRRLALVVDRRLATLDEPRSPLVIAVLGTRETGKSTVASLLSSSLSARGYTASVIDAARENLPDGRKGARVNAGGAAAPDAATSVCADIVLLDTPAFGEATEADYAVESADAAIVVVRPGRTSQQSLVDLSLALRTQGTPVLGVVANAAKAPRTVAGVYA